MGKKKKIITAIERWNDNDVKNVTWKEGIIYDLLHAVGDDPVKAQIERDLEETFDKKTLDKIAKIFVRACPDNRPDWNK